MGLSQRLALEELRPVAELRPVVEFTVRGLPVPQGSMRAFLNSRTGRPILTSTSKGLPAWRNAVATAASSAMAERPVLLGPLGLLVTFTLPRPRSAPKRITHPAVRPDLSKLIRAVEDALTGVVWRDDSQVVTVAARKIYGEAPGCRVGVTHPADELLAFDWSVTA